MSEELLVRAIERRGELLDRLHRANTDCYRLLHGVAEGRPGVTIDRYGPILLVQTWREPLAPGELDALGRTACRVLGEELRPVWNHRPDRTLSAGDAPSDPPVGHEGGVRYDVTPRHRGQDPLLFLDFRAGRRRILALDRGKSVLNLFAYTGGVSLCALVAGASEVWHVDFSRRASEWFRRNLVLNGIPDRRVRLVQDDVIPVLRQLAGLPVKGRAARTRPYPKLAPKAFDVVVLDPPRWAKSPFGAVDTVRDYPSLLKPALLATAPAGSLLVTNHAARVGRNEWTRMLERTGEKCGRPLASVTIVEPEEDFPTIDAEPPLKMAWLETR